MSKEGRLRELVREESMLWGNSVAESYYVPAERDINRQWNAIISPILSQHLIDYRVTMDFACGRGRNSKYLRPLSRRLALVDVNPENLAFCGEYFAKDDAVSLYQCSGYDLSGLRDGDFTFVYSFDAMVHLDLEMIATYLHEFFRVLGVKGFAFLHHSNYAKVPGEDFRANPYWRNYMSADLFKHLAIRSGFTVASQVVIPWGSVPDLDCISVLQKVAAEGERQIASLNHAIAERDVQIASHAQTVAERNATPASMYASTSWRLIAPYRWVGHQAKRARHLWRITPQIAARSGGLWDACAEAMRLYQREGLVGIKHWLKQVQAPSQPVGNNDVDEKLIHRNVYAASKNVSHPPKVCSFETEEATVTNLFCSKLNAADLARIYLAMDQNDYELLSKSDPLHQQRILLHLGVHYNIASVLRKTSLTSKAPPENVHGMAKGKLAAGGSSYYADLVADIVRKSGNDLGSNLRVLDFGCSSGRVARVLASAYPQLNCYGCDPSPDSIEWAKSNLPRVQFSISPLEPPLPYVDEFFDTVYAISIWSHFGPRAALNWFEEMSRILRPGGLLLFTTHGVDSIAHYSKTRERSDDQLKRIRAALVKEGIWFENEFGENGDWGIKHSEWGTAFVAPHWLQKHLEVKWRFHCYVKGRAEGNQDVILVQKLTEKTDY